MEDDKLAWKTIETEYPLDTKWMKVRKEKVRLPNGQVLDDFYIVDGKESVAVIAIDDAGRLLLAKQYRQAVGKVMSDLPGGCVEDGERPIETAKRELAEETGVLADSFKELLGYYPDSARISCQKHIFLAEGLRRDESGSFANDEAEDVYPVWLPLPEVLEKMRKGELNDAALFVGLAAYFNSRKPS